MANVTSQEAATSRGEDLYLHRRTTTMITNISHIGASQYGLNEAADASTSKNSMRN